MPSLDILSERAAACGQRLRVAVVCGYDASTQSAIKTAIADGYVQAIFVDDQQGCAQRPARPTAHDEWTERIVVADAAAAARHAVGLVRNGQADVLMKGLIGTDTLLRAVLDKQDGLLPANGTLTHVSVAALSAYDKLLCFSDAAVIPYPSPLQRRVQVDAVVSACRAMGVAVPRIALVHCSEKVSDKFPHTADYRHIVAEAAEGRWGETIIDGPLDLRTAIDPVALSVKGIASPIAGRADGLIFPDIEAANVFYKTATSLCRGETAGLLHGTTAPVVLPSRGDDAPTKSSSLALAVLMATAKQAL